MSRVRTEASVVGGGVPTYLTSGAVQNRTPDMGNISRAGAGDYSFIIGQGGFDGNNSILLATARAQLAASGLRGFGVVHTSDVAKQILSLQEAGGGGASVLTDMPYDFAAFDLVPERYGWFIVGAGSVSFPAGAPTNVWRIGPFGTFNDNGPGDISQGIVPGLDATECIYLCTPRVVLAASGLTSIGVLHASDTSKRITILQETAMGGASALTDVPFDWVVLSRKPEHHDLRLKLHAICSIVGGVGPTYRFRSPEWTSPIGRTGAGDYNLTLGANFSAAANNCAVIACPRGTVAGSQLRSVAVTHTSNTVKRLMMLQEGGAGAASALTDMDVDLAIFARAS